MDMCCGLLNFNFFKNDVLSYTNVQSKRRNGFLVRNWFKESTAVVMEEFILTIEHHKLMIGTAVF